MANPKVNNNKGANRILVLFVVLLLIALVVAVAYAALANDGYLKSRDRLDEAVRLYDAAITQITQKTNQAQATYVKANTRYSEAKTQTVKAENDYKSSLAKLANAEEAYEQARQSLASAETSGTNAAAEYALARTTLLDAQQAVAASQTALTVARSELADAKVACEDARNAYDAAGEKLQLAMSQYDQAVSDYQTAVELINSFVESGGSDTGQIGANQIYQNTINAIVEVRAYNIYDIYFKLGSGFFVSEDGRIVTNYHVIQNAFRLEVLHNDGEIYEVSSVLGYDADIDLAVIKIDKNDCLPLEISDKKPEVGDTIYAIGSNMGLTRTFTKGIVSYVDRDIEGFEANSYIHYVGITHSGNSGCAILDAEGKVIGVHQLGDAQTGDNGLAIPISQLSTFAHNKNETPTQMSINNAADISDSLLYSTDIFGNITITGVSSVIEDAIVRIPSEIDGKQVVALDWGANSANIYYVEHIVISEGIKSIGDNAFSSSYYLQSVSLPSTLNQLSQTAFSEATELYKIFMDGGAHFSLTNDVLYNAAGTVMYKYPLCKSDENNPAYTESFAVPSGVATICDFAMFYAIGLRDLVLPSSLRSIGTMSISYCLNLESINLPAGLDYIGVGALSTNISLTTSITIPSSVTVLGEKLDDGSGYIYKGPFFQCESLTGITFAPNSSLQTMGDSVFGYCLDLESVNGIYSGLSDVGDGIFMYCTSLVSVDLSATILTDIGMGAFRGCTTLTDVALPLMLTTIGEKSFYLCGDLQSIWISPRVESIGVDAFYGAASLASVVLPEVLKEIGEGAFYSCTALSLVNLQDTVITTLGAYSFCDTNLEVVSMPLSLAVVGEYAFAACSQLKIVVLSPGTLWLKTGAFMDCKALVEINAMACQYPPHLSDADVLQGTPDTSTITITPSNKQYFESNSAWMVYRARFNCI